MMVLAQTVADVAQGIRIDWSINLGQIIGGFVAGLLAIIGAYGAGMRLFHVVDLRLSKVEDTLTTHATQLTNHSADMQKHEGLMLEVMQDVARIVGTLSSWNGRDRRGK